MTNRYIDQATHVKNTTLNLFYILLKGSKATDTEKIVDTRAPIRSTILTEEENFLFVQRSTTAAGLTWLATCTNRNELLTTISIEASRQLIYILSSHTLALGSGALNPMQNSKPPKSWQNWARIHPQTILQKSYDKRTQACVKISGK